MTAFPSRRRIYWLATIVVAALGLEPSVTGIVRVANRHSEQAFATRVFQNALQGRLAALDQQSPSYSVAAPQFASSAGPCFDCARLDDSGDAIANARLAAHNRTGYMSGIDLLSQNFSWSAPLLRSDGRAGLGLNLTLSYNSLVWTRSDDELMFDADRGHPSPGFRLGFPTIQGRYRAGDGAWYYLLITESGQHVQLRQTSAPSIYESTDASLLELVDRGRDGAVLRRPSGTMLTFAWHGGQLQCTEIKDRNGNYLSMAYDDFGHLSQVTDTLGRIFTFERDAGGNLNSIVRTAGDAQAVVATFGYDDLLLSSTPSSLPVRGVAAGGRVKILTHLGLKDGSSVVFAYTALGQVWRIDRLAPDGHLLMSSSLNLPVSSNAPIDNAPRPSEVRTWVADADSPDATIVRVDVAPDHAWGRVTREDGSTRTEFFETGGRHDGLVRRMERRDVAGVLTLTEHTTWRDIYRGGRFVRTVRRTHDVVWQTPSNGEDTRTTYDELGMLVGTTTSKAGGITGRMQVAYNRTPAYVGRHVLHLPATVVTSGDAGETTTSFEYDRADVVDQGVAAQHDRREYGPSRTAGRGLVSTIRRRVGARTFEQRRTYNATGTLAQLSDSDGRSVGLDYTDVFTDGRARNAWAFATTSWTDAGVLASTYDYETGTAALQVDADGTVTEVERDRAGRTIRTANLRTGEVQRRVYSPTGDAVALFVKRPRWQGENALYTYYDGAGRSRAQLRGVTSRPHEFAGQRIVRNAAGRRVGRPQPLTVTRSQPSVTPLAWMQSGWDRVQTFAAAAANAVSPTLYAECYWEYGYDTDNPEWVCDQGGGGGGYDPWADNPFYWSTTDLIQSLNSGDPDYDDPYYQSLQAEALFGHWGLPPVSGVQMVVSGESNDVWAFYGQGSDMLDQIILQLQAAGLDGEATRVSWDGGGFHVTLSDWAVGYLATLSQYADPSATFTTGSLFGFHQEILLPGTQTISYRSYNGTYGMGSIQFVVNTTTGSAHIDVDNFNPNQDLVSLFGHAFIEVLPDLFELRDPY